MTSGAGSFFVALFFTPSSDFLIFRALMISNFEVLLHRHDLQWLFVVQVRIESL
jgi:hypothetical protein